MVITLSDELKNMLKRGRKDTITVYKQEALGCWGQQFDILVRINPPRANDKTGYEIFKNDDLTIYLDKELTEFDSIHLEVSKQTSDMPDRDVSVTIN